MIEYDLDAARKIPNQIKSLILSARPDISKVNWFEEDFDVATDPSTSLMFIWNYQNIAKIEYLHSYESSPTGRQINAPVWKPLTFAALNNLPSMESGIVACRLTKHDDSVNMIGYSKFAKIPYYNSYFFIAANQEVADTGGFS